MGKCVAAKFNGSYQNDNIPYFDALIFECTKNAKDWVNTLMASSEYKPASLTVEILSGNGYLTSPDRTQNYGTKHTYENANAILMVPSDNNPIKIKVSSKYSVVQIGAGSDGLTYYDLSLIDNANGLKYLSMPAGHTDEYFDISGLHLPSLERVNSGTGKIDIDTLKGFSATMKYISGYIFGVVEDLADFPLLEHFYCSYQSMTGSIERYVAALRSKGRISGSIGIRFSPDVVPFYGVVYTTGDKTLEWDATSIILKQLIAAGNKAWVYNITSAQRQALVDGGWTDIIEVTD